MGQMPPEVLSNQNNCAILWVGARFCQEGEGKSATLFLHWGFRFFISFYYYLKRNSLENKERGLHGSTAPAPSQPWHAATQVKPSAEPGFPGFGIHILEIAYPENSLSGRSTLLQRQKSECCNQLKDWWEFLECRILLSKAKWRAAQRTFSPCYCTGPKKAEQKIIGFIERGKKCRVPAHSAMREAGFRKNNKSACCFFSSR